MKYQLHHIHLLCSNLGEMVSFFSDVLGAKFVDWRKFQGADGAVLDLNGTSIYLRVLRGEEKISPGPAPLQYGYNHIGLTAEDLEKTFSDLTTRGIKFTQPPKDLGNRIAAFIQGPDGLSIEFIQFKKEKSM